MAEVSSTAGVAEAAATEAGRLVAILFFPREARWGNCSPGPFLGRFMRRHNICYRRLGGRGRPRTSSPIEITMRQ